MNYKVSQTYETLGDPAAETFPTRGEAEAGAVRMRGEIAAMVAEWETPASFNDHRGGCIHESEAWDEAERLAGVEYGEDGDRTASSPKKWGLVAGEYIAGEAVEIEEIEEEDPAA